MQTKTKINIFTQFGFIEQNTTDTQSVGRCPFCGKDKHFYYNVLSENKTWDCKSCGRSGGYKTFLQQMVSLCKKTNKNKILSLNRHISSDTLDSVNIGYHELTKQYIIPIYSIDKKEILNIKLYDGETMRNLAGCTSNMYILQDDIFTKSDIMICEGEWDTLVIYEIINILKLKNVGVVGVPGAGVFKTEFMSLFTDKNIYLLYDNDEAGKNGAEKAVKLLSSIVRTILKIKWPEGFDAGFDIRDLYKKGDAQTTWKTILKWCEPVELKRVFTPAVAELLDEIKAPDYRDIINVYKKWLHLTNTDFIDMGFGTMLGNRLQGDPLWIFLVGEPGTGKTELIMSMSECAYTEAISALTPHSLISGANFGGGDPSLIPKLDGKVLLIKDFTDVLTMPIMAQEEIYGIFRDAYDGECQKTFGNGIMRRYKSRFGIFAGVTPIIDYRIDELPALGERFLRFRISLPKEVDARKEFILRAINNAGEESQMRKEIREAAKSVLRIKYTSIPTVSNEYKNKIAALSQFISILRGVVVRDKYTKDILHKSFVELGTRIGKQLNKLLQGVGMFHGTEIVGTEEYKIAKHIARSTTSDRIMRIIKIMYNSKETINIESTAKEIGLPFNTIKLVIENLMQLNAAIKIENSYKLSLDMEKLIKDSGVFK
jgi:hypothetical protein